MVQPRNTKPLSLIQAPYQPHEKLMCPKVLGELAVITIIYTFN